MSAGSGRCTAGRGRGLPRVGAASAVLGLMPALLLSQMLACGESSDPAPALAADVGARRPVEAEYAGSDSCRECHQEAYETWAQSHHARAEQPLGEADRRAFTGHGPIEHGSLSSEVRVNEGALEIVTVGADGQRRPHAVERSIGVDPLVQYLVPGERGRLQTAALSYDPNAHEWFDVFGDEDRRPGEWGHWTGQGMNWNAMCADCHNTDVRKDYDPDTDTYHTHFIEMGVGCESCHGPSAPHVRWQREQGGATGDPNLPAMTNAVQPQLWIEACGACHSRRGELRDVARPDDLLLDSFLPELPGLGGLYHADGKVLEEDYEYSSFRLSRMSHHGVTCLSCHDPHRAAPKLAGNDLCLSCHKGRLSDELGPIDPATHSHHDPAGEGGQCINCHMPQTTYMQRDPRHDHSFSIPDPRLTLEHGIPNACSSCHQDQTPRWAMEAAEEWYGDRLNRPYRQRARLVARARDRDPSVVPELLEWIASEPYPAWRGVAASCLREWVVMPGVVEALQEALEDEDALVRTSAVRALEDVAEYVVEDLRLRLEDPVRAVRVTAAWNLRATVELGSLAGEELMDYLRHNSDQPQGLLMQSQLWQARGRHAKAVELLEKALRWEKAVPELWRALCIALSGAGRTPEAAERLEEACEKFPRDPALWHSLGLVRHELKDHEGSVDALRRAVELDSRYPRGWYNLGYALHGLKRWAEACEALENALQDAPGNLDAWILRAEAEIQLGHADRARWAAENALRLDEQSPQARAVLRELEQRGR